MKKTALFSACFLLFSFVLSAQNTGNISLAFSEGKIVIKGDSTKSYDTIVFTFAKEFKNHDLNFYDKNKIIPLYKSAKKLGENIGEEIKSGDSIIVKILKNDKKYIVDGLPEQVTEPFLLKIDNFLLGPFNLKPTTAQPKTLNDTIYEAGYIYYDAIKLDVSTDVKLKRKILDSYKVDWTNPDSNPYLSSLIRSCTSNEHNLTLPSLLTNLGNTDVTTFAAGLARFLAERAKEELNEAFFSKMKEQLNAYPELKTVFPKTSSFLNIIETYSYASVFQVLKESFETDVQNLAVNLYNIKDLTSADCKEEVICGVGKKDCKPYNDCEARLQTLNDFFKTEVGQWLGLGLFTVKETQQSSNPAALIKSVTGSLEFKALKGFLQTNDHLSYNITSSIELGNFISQSLISKTDQQTWINPQELNVLFKNDNTTKIYLGLLLAMCQKGDVTIDYYDSKNSVVSLKSILLTSYINFTDIVNLIKNTHTVFNSANNAVRKIVAASDKSVESDPQSLYTYYRTFTASLKPIIHSQLLKTYISDKFCEQYDTIEKYLNPSIDLVYHISTKKYSAAVYDASILLSNINGFVDSKKKHSLKPVTKSFVKYGILISTVANAQTSDEVKQAIEASVLPVGSSSIKRKSAWSISINSYVGPFYGIAHSTVQDTLRNSSTKKLDTITKAVTYKTFGLSAPIGLSFNRGFKCGWGITLSVQVLDLGALVNFYLTEGDKASLPADFKIKLSDILSPGIQLAINIPKTPLTIMGGVQYVPALHNASQISSNPAVLSPVAWRGQISIVVDIPLYNLKVWDFTK